MSNFIIDKLYIELTNKCNLRCKHCYNDSNGFFDDEMNQNILFKLFSRIKEYSKIKRVIISGGEVTIYPYVEQLLKHLCSIGIPFTIITNGMIFPTNLYKYFDDKHNQIQISLEGPTAVENDYVRGKGSFDKAITTVKELIANNIITYFRFSLTSLNYNKIEDMVLLALDNKIGMVNFSNLFPYGRCKENDELFIDNEQLITSLSLLRDCKKKYEDSVYIDIPDKVVGGCPIINKTECIAINARIDINGNLYLCQMFNNATLVSGNIEDYTIEEILSSSQNTNIINLINSINAMRSECNKCYAFNICKYGCPAISLSNNFIWGNDGVCECRKYIMNQYLHCMPDK